MNPSKHSRKFSEDAFLKKLIISAIKAGEKVIHTALLLFFAFQKKQTPLWAKAVIAGALGYFITPLDAIPDFLAVVGYSDDFGAMVSALSAIAMYIDEDVDKKAKAKMKVWFGEDYKANLNKL